ncbi:unnamed protein product [Eruca vesicaria subsp. sativa]|uniref:Epidermal patterning factor-like protein n=1 Tax=Eruca vesicaria subsp. sativa TaxID=29727 RepID=A0ABC8LP82_ERUVS|nr:unnamed protein product [Eruca vesicaria subsp. sativa]
MPRLSLSSRSPCSCLCVRVGHLHVGRTTGKVKRQRRPDTVQVAGSRLPDCSHACGSCSPCHLMMVSFVCASLAEVKLVPWLISACATTNPTPSHDEPYQYAFNTFCFSL